VIGKRLSFALLAGALLAGTFVASPPAGAGDRCDRGYGRRSHYRGGGYHRGDYGGGYRRAGYYRTRGYRGEDDCYRPRRRARYDRTYSYRPVRRTVYVTDYRPSYRRSAHRGYNCGECGSHFASRRWLTYHRSHTSCG
jgi:hypothetical protein